MADNNRHETSKKISFGIPRPLPTARQAAQVLRDVMTGQQHDDARTADAPQRIVTGREFATTAPARCGAYACWSELVASPHDVDARASLVSRRGIGSKLPIVSVLDELIDEFTACDPARLKREYSSLFEVGSDGPPVPIREDLQTGQRAGTREELVRFYDFFGYSLDERFAWAPDHLSVQLEFVHFLCYREASAENDPTSFQLAQHDFCERHLANWLPACMAQVESSAPDSLYSRVIRGLSEFVEADLAWQRGTIALAPENA